MFLCLQLMLRPERVKELRQRRKVTDNQAYARVTAGIAAAVAWRAQVVGDDTKPGHYQ
jgi:hypothetical protein